MEIILESLAIQAFFWGALSAFSLPAGAMIGLAWNPQKKINSAFMAFGAGALLFALTIELFSHAPHAVHEYGTWAMIAVVGGAILGGLFFDMLNRVLNNMGAFHRKLSSAKRYVAKLKFSRALKLLEELGHIKALAKLPPEKMAQLIHSVYEEDEDAGEKIFAQGDEASDMYFIIDGEIDIVLHEKDGEEKTIATLGQGEIFGEMGILLGVNRTADAVARTDVRLYKLTKQDFDQLSKNIPELKSELITLAESRLTEMSVKSPEETDKEWMNRTLSYLSPENVNVTMEDMAKEGHHGSQSAAMAIWLGILIDGIPESLIIGILLISPGGMSLAFVAGVFLANFPEAMSSAVSMKRGGMPIMKILIMWGSLCIMTGIGAVIGAVIFPADVTGNIYILVLAIEGLAAGAMLTMIAETMLPEAFEQGGTIVGLSTLMGFLVALLVKIYF